MATEGKSPVRDEDPLVAGVVRGVRKWEVGRDRRGNPRLLGYANWAWHPWGRPSIATCLAHYGVGHKGDGDEAAPATECTCGLYAHHPWARKPMEDWDLLTGVSPEDDWMIGVVEAWGRLEVHEDGFRAQFARPVLLIASKPDRGEETETLDRVAAEYRCSAIRIGSAAGLREVFGEVEGALDPSFVKDLIASIPEPAPWIPPPPPRVRTWSEPRDWIPLTGRSVSRFLEYVFDGIALVARGIGMLIMGGFAVLFYLSWLIAVGTVVGGCGVAVVESF